MKTVRPSTDEEVKHDNSVAFDDCDEGVLNLFLSGVGEDHF